jgi:hypothetical protein
MSDSLSTLLRGLAEALTPYLAPSEDGIDVDDAVDRAISGYDFDDIIGDNVNQHIRHIEWSEHDVLTEDGFRPEDYELMDASDIDVAICEGVEAGISEADLVTADAVRDIVTEELQNTGAVVTVDNILSVLQGALSNAAAKAERAA